MMHHLPLLRFLCLGLLTATLTCLSAADNLPFANQSLGEDPAVLPATSRAQAEPHIIRSFTDPGLAVAVFQEGRQTAPGGALAIGCAVTRDGGETWTRSVVPQLSVLSGGTYDRITDPVTAVDLHGHIYVNALGFNVQSTQVGRAVLLTRSTDGGVTFEPPTVVHATDTSTPAANDLPDKNWIAINTYPETPHPNRIAVTWTRFSEGDSPPNPIVVVTSDDRGATWSIPQVISPASCQGSYPVFLPDGALAVLYFNFAGPQLELAVSDDGGQTFANPRLVTRVNAYKDPVARDGVFVPSLATDRLAGLLYVAYQARFSTPTNSRPAILFTRSRDRGRTWTGPVPINDTPGQSVFMPAIAVSPDGQQVTVVFYDKRHDPEDRYLADLYLAESFDGGQSWHPNRRLSSASSDLRKAPLTATGFMLGDYLGIVPALGPAYPGIACWIDARDATPDPYVQRLGRAEGGTFAAWRQLVFAESAWQNEGISGPAADPDGDGQSNWTEYALGTPPQEFNQRPLALQATTSSGQPPRLRWETPVVSTLADVDYSVELSNDLRIWRRAAEGTLVRRTHPLAYMEVLEISSPAQSDSQGFQRLSTGPRVP
jgi:hypothetical protein